MCGIAGEFRFASGPGQANWATISELMQRRGPDDAGAWQDDHCNLVFRRLSILDLSAAGHQPMVSGDGRYVLIFNGEVYNFTELRPQLEARGINFRSNSDSEVVLYVLAEWGRAALDRFNGMFALAFYDTRERTLLLARDHAGIKPLYYLEHPRGLMFGSQYDQLLAHPWSGDLSFSSTAATLYLHLASVPAPWGILEDTHMLEAGSWLEVSANGRIGTGAYYEFPRHQVPLLRGQEAMDAVNSSITAAGKRQLVSDVPIGAFLSGGVDSPLVCAKMQEVGDTRMRPWRQLMRVTRRLTRLPHTGSHRYSSIGHWQRAMHTRLPEAWLRRVFPEMSAWPAEYDQFDYAGCDPDDAAQWLRRNEFISHLAGVLLKVDRASMYNSLEVRVPLLDREVIDTAVQVDWKDCFDPLQGSGKIPLRKSLARHLDHQTTAKKGFEHPWASG